MRKQAAGILMYRRGASGLEVLLAHPGGPLWARKDAGAWTIPKGKPEAEESLLDAAFREFEEEVGVRPEGTSGATTRAHGLPCGSVEAARPVTGG